MTDTAHPPEPPFHLFLDSEEASAAASAVRLYIDDEAHESKIRELARGVLAGLSAAPDERGRLTVELTPGQMKITYSAAKLLLNDLQRGQAPERELLRSVLEKLPDEHTMRAIELP
jgi:hypothetical protein